MGQPTKLFDSAPAAVPVSRPASPVPEQETTQVEGPRKLVRPRVPEHFSKVAAAPRRLRGLAPLAMHEGQAQVLRGSPARAAASQAETLYFQKQIQAQTPMVVVLEDGEQIKGVVEWFDRDTIKVRNTTRTLIFKRSIKYLYKADGDTQA